jgi:tetratricopeptide (TPR) repeat protein
VAAAAATALRAPTMLAPIVRPGGGTAVPPTASTLDDPSVEPGAPDPEQVLASYQWRFHHDTLRELVEEPDELREIRDRLTEKLNSASDNPTRARLLSLRAVVSRILGDLGKALSDGKLAVAHAEATGELRRIAIVQARLAHVLQWRGDFAEADRLFEQANSPELPDRLRATVHEHAGRSCYDQGRYMEACNHFERALELRKVEDPELIARTEVALDAVFRKVAENGWGPYPRSREEILQLRRPPTPAFDERTQRWGFIDAAGASVIVPAFADVQPFRDGVAWVRRPDVETWELIDEAGQLLIDAYSSYLGVGSFSDGLAWVSRDGTAVWIAIDKANRVVIGSGFDDVRPFRRGVAAVRKGGWGAVDRSGRVVVPFHYHGFATALTDGRYVDGFTDEGLAIVDQGGRRGVVDRTGQVIVPPVHPAVVIHPVAFLVAGPDGRWGALDRRGRPLLDPQLPSRAAVTDELDRLLADTKPVL